MTLPSPIRVALVDDHSLVRDGLKALLGVMAPLEVVGEAETGAEAMALRCLVIDLLHRTSVPLVVLGDFNDTPDSVTTQLICATTEIAYDRSARDVALFNAYDLQGDAALKKDVAYSHIHQGSPSVLDQILVSEEFMATGRNSVGDVRRVDYFNDHLHEGRDRTRSDHGFVRALLRLKMPPATPQSPP